MSKYKDWRGWWDGMRSVAMKAGAESFATNLSALLATNGVASTIPTPFFESVGMNWKTAIVTMCIQFIIRSAAAAAKYVADKPDPDVVGFDTAAVTKQTTNEETTK